MDNFNSLPPQVISDLLTTEDSVLTVNMELPICGLINIKGILKDIMNYKEKLFMPKLAKQLTNFSSSLLLHMISAKYKQLLLFHLPPPSQHQILQIMDFIAWFRKLNKLLSSMEVDTMLLAIMGQEGLLLKHLLEESARITNIF